MSLKSQNRNFVILGTLSIMLLLLAACGGDAEETSPPTEVSVQLAWTHNFHWAVFYAAEQDGHFEAQNLDVTLLNGGFNEAGYINPIDKVLNGDADFGIADAFGITQPQDLIGKWVALTTGAITWTYETMLVEQGGIEADAVDIESAYTLEFLEKARAAE